jgi:hypothetical protein
MLKRLLSYFASAKLPEVPYHHPELGTFDFTAGVGWGKTIDIDGRHVQVYLGSNGQMPSQPMLDCLGYWISNWMTRRPEFNEYIDQECRSWPPHDIGPEANRLSLSSIEILWPEQPWSCMIYLNLPGDDERQFHLTFDERVPIGFAYDH